MPDPILGEVYVIHREAVSAAEPKGTGWNLAPKDAWLAGEMTAARLARARDTVGLSKATFMVDLAEWEKGRRVSERIVSGRVEGTLAVVGGALPEGEWVEVFYHPLRGPAAFVTGDEQEVWSASRVWLMEDGRCFAEGARG